MKRVTIVLVLLLALSACAPVATEVSSQGTQPLQESSVQPQSKTQLGPESEVASTTIDTGILTEKKAHEILSDWENWKSYSKQYGYVLSSRNHYTENIKPLNKWMECYRTGKKCEAVILYYGSVINYIFVFTCNGTAEYTITQYTGRDAIQFQSAMVTERVTDYTFGANINGKMWCIPIKKESVKRLHENAGRYDADTWQFPDVQSTGNMAEIYLYDADARDYTKRTVDASGIRSMLDYLCEIENSFGRPLFIDRCARTADGVIYMKFSTTLHERGFSKGAERAVLYSIARTVMENETDALGVCFESDGGMDFVPYDGLFDGTNEICIPPGAAPLGALTIERAQEIATERVAWLFEDQHPEYTGFDPDSMVLELYAAKYIEGVLCYLFHYYENEHNLSQGLYSGTFALDVETGSVFYSISGVDGAYILESDENETRIMPESEEAVEAIDTGILTEEKAHEILKDEKNYELYSEQYGYPIASTKYSHNVGQMEDWIECYRTGKPAEVALLYYGSPMMLIFVLTADGTAEYTITEYNNIFDTVQIKSSMVIERMAEYTFGADLGDKGWPIVVKKENDQTLHENIDRYAVQFSPVVPKQSTAEIYMYDTDKKDYTKRTVDADGLNFMDDYIAEIEQSFGTSFGIKWGFRAPDDFIYINFYDALNQIGFSPDAERAVLYSLARTIMENETGVLGVCFEVSGQSYNAPENDIYYWQNEACLPPGATLPG
ncbi:MAG: hypothetical protein ACERKO_10755, partial [Acetanaerobacterium sp.]